jgi:hypothetical protein
MIIEKIGSNILDATENIICQQVNCKGVMSAGLAKEISLKYHRVYPDYKRHLLNEDSPLGTVSFTEVDIDKIVACLYAQDDYGRSKKKVYTKYWALESSLEKVKTYANINVYTVAIPYGMGCGLANGDWNTVQNIINRIFKNSVATIYKLGE